jgi:hypothetical protein
MMADRVFICYSRKDKDFVLELAANLENRGVPIWLDQWDILPGDDWDLTIEKALNDCTRLLLVISPSSVDSEEVRSEWRSALDKGKIIVPILHKPCKIPYRLNSIQYIDFTSCSPDNKESIEQILNTLRMVGSPFITRVAQPKFADSQVSMSKWPNSKDMIIIVEIVSIIIIISFIGYSLNNRTSTNDRESLPIVWTFSKDLDGWDRIGTILEWKPSGESPEWKQNFGDSAGVVVMDSCNKSTENPPINATSGIKKDLRLPSEATKLVADIVKDSNDGAIIFSLIDANGKEKLLGIKYLVGRQIMPVSYDISSWAGQAVTLKILSFGWGEDGDEEGCPAACCHEYVGIDKVEIF